MRGDVTKLPKWAQAEIARLEAAVEHWKAVVAVGPDDSNTFADPWSDAPRPLGHGVTIEYVMTTGEKIRVSLERNRVTGMYDRLNVNGDNIIAIRPAAANSVDIVAVQR